MKGEVNDTWTPYIWFFEKKNDWDGEIKQSYIFLKGNKDDELSSIVAQAISLDIRGNYGDIWMYGRE